MRRGDWIGPSGGEITLGQLTDDWIHRSRVANTIAGRKTFRKQLGDLEDVPIGALTPMHFREWEYQLRNGRPWRDGKPLAETTVNGYVREMGSMLTTAVNEERIRRNPARNLKTRKVTRRISPDEVLTVDLVNDMIERFETGRRRMTKAERAAARRGELDAWAGMNAVPEMGYVVRMAAAMGPRPSELLDIRLEDIDVARGTGASAGHEVGCGAADHRGSGRRHQGDAAARGGVPDEGGLRDDALGWAADDAAMDRAAFPGRPGVDGAAGFDHAAFAASLSRDGADCRRGGRQGGAASAGAQQCGGDAGHLRALVADAGRLRC